MVKTIQTAYCLKSLHLSFTLTITFFSNSNDAVKRSTARLNMLVYSQVYSPRCATSPVAQPYEPSASLPIPPSLTDELLITIVSFTCTISL